jgi:hypothetical protein
MLVENGNMLLVVLSELRVNYTNTFLVGKKHWKGVVGF